MNPTDSSSANAKLIASCQGLVKSIAWNIHQKVPKHVELDDLIGYGQVGLAEAARGFDESRGGQFTTYAYYRIRGAILDGLARMQWFSAYDFHAGKYERLADSLLEGESEPAAEAAAPVAKASDQVAWFAETSTMLAMAYLMSGHGSDDDRGAMEPEDRSTPLPGADVAKRELTERLHALIDDLPENMGKLIRASYFGGLTLTEAGKTIGISKSRASRLHAEALGHLARSLRRAQLVD
jgi:RNA polymerase sigma factor for flagellar operon FliA